MSRPTSPDQQVGINVQALTAEDVGVTLMAQEAGANGSTESGSSANVLLGRDDVAKPEKLNAQIPSLAAVKSAADAEPGKKVVSNGVSSDGAVECDLETSRVTKEADPSENALNNTFDEVTRSVPVEDGVEFNSKEMAVDENPSTAHSPVLHSTNLTSQTLPPTPPRTSTPPKYSAPAYQGLPKYSIPSRRPKGWISSLNHPRIVSDLSPKGKISLTPPRASSTSVLPDEASSVQESETEQLYSNEIGIGPRQRITSVHAQGRQEGVTVAGGRRVSGAMQYAIAPIRHVSTAPSDLSLETGSDQHDTASQASQGEANEGEDHHDLLEGRNTSVSAEDEAQIRYDVGLAQDQDEVWMAYVRAQLGALFPDFFDANPTSLEPNFDSLTRPGERTSSSAYFSSFADEQEDPGHDEVNEQHSPLGDVFTASTPANTSFGLTDDTSSLATPLSSSAGMLRGNVSIPNVREEISGLREEIMRLRSVVGGLAEGMGRPQRAGPIDSTDEIPEEVELAFISNRANANATDSAVPDDEVEAGAMEGMEGQGRTDAAEANSRNEAGADEEQTSSGDGKALEQTTGMVGYAESGMEELSEPFKKVSRDAR
ncbi:hypothetical protein I317_05526 [Kwoniella heveanensis CBS 569]|nr:hypothetical protein I317_05526 [Kwoniella heveanensis CBS 569]